MNTTLKTDVLIVGAGPTGLMLANQLARRGVRPMIIDRHGGPAEQTRAIGVQARTLEIYAKLGLIETALSLGKRMTGANMWANGRRTARIPLGDMGRDLSPFPFILMLGQDDNERIMGDLLGDHCVRVRWRTELTGLVQQEDHVDATLRRPDGSTEQVSASWVAGCDGSRSPVREMCGIGFPGAPYEHTFFVADTEATGSMRPGELNVYLWDGGFHLFFPMRGKDRWRMIGILPKRLRACDDLEFDDVAPAIRDEAGTELDFKACDWFSTYRIQHRAAERFRDRRCFLLGDAAHIHSPAGAQGMNTGLQDAYNLAWKLALVVQGRAAPQLLDSYEAERVPVARRLLQTTDRAFQFIVAEGWLGRLFRTRILARIAAFAMTIERARRLAFLTISQTGITYPASPLSQQQDRLPAGAPAAGDRFPWLHLRFGPSGRTEDLFQRLDDQRFNLLVFGQAPPERHLYSGFGELLAVHAIAADPGHDAQLRRARVPLPSFYLLRPDGHVGLCGLQLEMSSIEEYLQGIVRLQRKAEITAGSETPHDPMVSSRAMRQELS